MIELSGALHAPEILKAQIIYPQSLGDLGKSRSPSFRSLPTGAGPKQAAVYFTATLL